MTQIYEKHFWGGNDFDFYSGEGSHNSKIVNPYLDSVVAFLSSHNNALTVCDLGCGDFNIGKQLAPFTSKYIGIDIVDALIERNKGLFMADNIEFECLNIATHQLPRADCVILRQVLQHLSNEEIKMIVNKLIDFKYIVLTEHLPLGNFEPNKDIITGQSIRLKHNSGVDILAPPFNLKIKEEVMHLNIVLESNKDYIVTRIYKCF
ncbi:class I SAM-dependent methyltransferase [Winogradskyella sp. DF17]|uniref:Class I SAM-dependent methyltransferase n=1 Tax=Winogradskyella pelagia TaxID=2819984 RepID=A0ABS3T308_9FLAO|nr:class I SAM-dependent methyltransferase [Winogradskyella sp. DF17]MBO3117122.1 class I SAM-dependent methyltransferase [Winogradskyella sp. DF17]